MKTAHLTALSSALLLSLAGCGDDGESIDAGPDQIIDAMPLPDVVNGVVCANAQANYGSAIQNPQAEDDGTTLEFFGDLDAGSPPDRLRLSIADNAATPTGSFELPMGEWSVSICLDDNDGSCANELVAYSGTLAVTSVSDRLQASLNRVIFVDSLATPTCSASLTQASLDVAISGPP
jgi:hypothetical protein